MSKILLAPRDCCGARVDTSVRLERSGQNDTSVPKKKKKKKKGAQGHVYF
jgi:hypothetical protein